MDLWNSIVRRIMQPAGLMALTELFYQMMVHRDLIQKKR